MLPLQLVDRYGDCARFGAFHPSSSAGQLGPSPFVSDRQSLRTAVYRREARFSNRPVGVKRYQTIRGCGADVARGLVLLYGIDTSALPSWDSKTRWNNLFGGLADGRQVQADMRTHLIHRPARDIIPPLGGAQVSSYGI